MDVLARTKELLGSLADVTESGSKIARYKIEVANLDRKLGLALRRVGERAWQLHTEGRTDIGDDSEVQAAFEEVRKLAHSEKTTLKALVEEGLRKVISERDQRESFRLRKAAFKGKGLQPQVAGTSWEQIRAMSYEGRGG